MIDKGHIWRIGDGKRLDVWRAKWLPKGHSHMIETVRPNDIGVKKVSDFIKCENRTWDVGKS